MNGETHELIRICQQLLEAEQHEVVGFARHLLACKQGDSGKVAVERWLSTARGAAKRGISMDEIMALIRGEPCSSV